MVGPCRGRVGIVEAGIALQPWARSSKEQLAAASLPSMFRRLNGKPRPEPDIDVYHGHPSPGTRIWDRRSGPVVDGSGPMQDLPLGA